MDMESWIKVNKDSGTGNDTVSITLESNKSSKDRTGTVDVATSTLNKILSIIQKGSNMTTYCIEVSADDVNINADAKIYKGSEVISSVTFAHELNSLLKQVYNSSDILIYVKIRNKYSSGENIISPVLSIRLYNDLNSMTLTYIGLNTFKSIGRVTIDIDGTMTWD